ncbi:hypothetical protein NMG60_11029858 [Bertholletia excelsa]
MAGHSLVMKLPKCRQWRRCSAYFRERRARFYIMWRCLVILLRWNE